MGRGLFRAGRGLIVEWKGNEYNAVMCNLCCITNEGQLMEEVMVRLAEPHTPAAHWRVSNQDDPFDCYDVERAALPYGHLTDDEFANEMYSCDHRKSFESMAYLTLPPYLGCTMRLPKGVKLPELTLEIAKTLVLTKASITEDDWLFAIGVWTQLGELLEEKP